MSLDLIGATNTPELAVAVHQLDTRLRRGRLAYWIKVKLPA